MLTITGARTRVLTLLATVVTVLAASLVASPTAQAAGSTLRLQRTTSSVVVNGGTVTFAGTATGVFRGRPVVLDRAVGGGRWVSMAYRTFSSSGRVSVAARASGVGVNTWRLRVKIGTKTYVSPTLSTRVYGWYYLSTMEEVDSNRIDEGPSTIGGVRYDHSILSGSSFWYDDNQWAEWNLGYKCRQFAASYGLDDQSATGSKVRFDVARDGARSYVGTKGLGRASAVSMDMIGVMRIRLDLTYAAGPTGSGDTSPYGSYGNARVLCSSRPAPPAY